MKLSPVEHALGLRGNGSEPSHPLTRTQARKLLAALERKPVEEVRAMYLAAIRSGDLSRKGGTR